ncbi:MAG TPA: aspartate/glutamate racemase family protein [Candidatus Paceibacterota bacterium]
MIGIFDSGVGGLTVLSAMRAVYPSIDVIYFGDTANAPYGSRSREELTELTVANIQFLLDRGATTIVSACNSVSASLALSVYDMLSVRPEMLIEMVGPCVAAFRGSGERLALCATVATIESGIYQSAFRMIGKDVLAFPIPELANAIESGADEDVYQRHIEAALASVPTDAYDCLILGCTHYPLAIEAFRRLIPDKKIFDPAEAVAERVLRDLWPREMGYGTSKFFLSRDSVQFRTLVRELFPDSEPNIEVITR